MNFGRNLMNIRKLNDYSQEELASLLGVSRQTLYTWEADLAYPNVVMLQKLARVLKTSVDDLIMGADIRKLPKELLPYRINKTNKGSVDIEYREVPNWFIKLEEGAEVNFALYDNGQRDYSYHLMVVGQCQIHDETGYEIMVEEYDEKQNKEATFSLVARQKDEHIAFIARISNDNGVKKIETYKDSAFLMAWGSGKDNLGQSIRHAKAEVVQLIYGETSYEAYKLVYHEEPNLIIELFVDKAYESLLWKRYKKNHASQQQIMVDGASYGFEYECITDRLR